MKLKDFLTLKVGSGIILSGNVYNPLINYDWSTTTTSQEYKTDGVELVTNGGFDTDSDWTKNAGSVIANGRLDYDGVKNTVLVYQNTLVVGQYVVVTYTISNYVSGSFAVLRGGLSKLGDGAFRKSNGTYQDYGYVDGNKLYLKGDNNFIGSIDNISVQKVIQEPNKRYLKDVGSTPTYNASMYFGRGAYLNGVDQSITVPINTTIQTALKRVNGVVTISETSQTLTNYVISGLGVHKDYYLFTRLLTTAEKDSYTNTPELFYAMAQADSTCVLNMPMCETSSMVRNYKTGIDYAITNYTISIRDNAKNLQYGLQTCKFVRDSLGVIQGASNYLECDGTGYANTGWIPNATNEDFTIEMVRYCPSNANIDGDGNNKDDSSRLAIVQTGNIIYLEIGVKTTGDNQHISGITTNVYNHIIVSYNSTTKKVICYLNGIARISYITNLTTSTNSLYIGMSKYSKKSTSQRRLFKFHNKALTQAEITENYNNYVAKGLLL